jgi:hypothetical protein
MDNSGNFLLHQFAFSSCDRPPKAPSAADVPFKRANRELDEKLLSGA